MVLYSLQRYVNWQASARSIFAIWADRDHYSNSSCKSGEG